MSVSVPPRERPPSLTKIVVELGDELRRRPTLPPGELRPSLPRSHRFQRDPLGSMLGFYERFGPVYSARMVHRPVVFLIGPEANHFVTVSGAQHFSWRRGMFGEQLSPLLGAGLITSDWEYHDRARKIMMPAFHRKRMDAALDVMVDEAGRALADWQPGATIDVYHWIRDLSMSIAMRALMGLDPHGGKGHEAAEVFERALSFYLTESPLMVLRGPRTPWAKFMQARRELDALVYEQIAQRRRSGEVGEDILSMLIATHDEDGDGFSDRELRDQINTILFGGHDTSSSTFSFLMYELAHNPDVRTRVMDEIDGVLAGRAPTVDELSNELPELDRAMDETLRMYPPVWFGPRLAVTPFEFGGHHIPAGTHIVHSSWATQRLAHVFPDPDRFDPDRFLPEARRELPKGAYIPFGGGQRICIGKRFGQLVVKAVAVTLLQHARVDLTPGYELTTAIAPTLSPKGALRMLIQPRR
jgi:cytochrome P450